MSWRRRWRARRRRHGAARPSSSLINLELEDEAGHEVEQQFIADQRLDASKTKKPCSAGLAWKVASNSKGQSGAPG
jgi:hypothetical protein